MTLISAARRLCTAFEAELLDQRRRRGDCRLDAFIAAHQGVAFPEPASSSDGASTAASAPAQKSDLPALRHLPGLLAQMQASPAVCDALRETARLGQWIQSYGGDPLTEPVADALVFTQPIGPASVVPSQSLRVTLFLIAPDTLYPLHDHRAEEIYFLLSGDLEVQHGFDGPMVQVEAGDYSITPPGMPHALRVGPAGALIHAVWIGEAATPSWWYEIGVDGRFLRRLPVRPAAARVAGGIA